MHPDITQDNNHTEGLPLGTRGGTLNRHHFPQDGEYELQVWLMRDRNDEIEGLRGTHELEILLNRERKAAFAISPPPPSARRRSPSVSATVSGWCMAV